MIGSKDNKKRAILLVEDEKDIRLLYAEILTDAGYIVIQAVNGNEGKEKIQNENWDVLLLDVILPEKDGMAILKDLRDSECLQKGPIILLTNLKSDHVPDEAYKLGATGYIVKSDITPDKILNEVKRVLK
ncbi:response regulator [Patescibacteria group bacterium]|nr:response regulator [Patescibacteria group bacterium]